MFKRRQKNAKRNWSIGNNLQSSAIKRHFGTRRCLILECLPRWHCSPMFPCASKAGLEDKVSGEREICCILANLCSGREPHKAAAHECHSLWKEGSC